MHSSALPPFPNYRYLGADWLGETELAYLQEAIESRTLFRHYGMGKARFTEDFEALAREKFGARFALAVSSGSGALFCALAGIGIGPGDEVILPAFSWFSCYNAIVAQGALPVFADSDRSLNLDPDDVARKVTPHTKAVIVVHYQAGASRLDELRKLCDGHKVCLLEDCAQAMGGSFQGNPLGTIGDVGTFSLQGNKILTAGEGGLILTNDPTIFERAVRYHDSGSCRPSFAKQLDEAPYGGATFPGSQFRMGELTGAVALAQLEKLDSIIGGCKHAWMIVRNRLLEAMPDFHFRTTEAAGDAGITLFCDMGTAERATLLRDGLKERGIPLGASSGMCNLLQTQYVQTKGQAHPALPPFGPGWAGEHLHYGPELAPNITDILASMVDIPMGPRYEDVHAIRIANAIVEVCHRLA